MYTVYGPEVNKAVQSDLDKIIETILGKIDPVSIILFGGFGKGEGSIEVTDGSIVPLNDYDLYVVTDGQISDSMMEEIGMICSSNINVGGLDFVEHPFEEYDKNKFFHVDLRSLDYNNLQNLLPTQRTFELKNSSQTIWGKDITPEIPDVKVSKSDALRLLFNKCDHLLLGADKSADIKKIYLSKAYTDLCVSLLIIEDDFSGFYSERAEKIQNHNFPKRLVEKIQFYTNYRLRPVDNPIIDLDKEYDEAKKWVEFGLKYSLKNTMGINDDEWPVISQKMYSHLPFVYFNDYLPNPVLFPAQYYMNIRYTTNCFRKGRNVIKPLISWKDVGLTLAISLLLFFYGEHKLSETYLRKVTNDVHPLKEKVLEYYGYYYLQKII